MEKKNMYREYFPGYCGHIPYKYEVIGKTVGATNYHIKSLLTKEPDYSQTYIPSINKDYTYYKKYYFNNDFAKDYELKEDKIFLVRTKEACTWIDGNKYQLYPEQRSFNRNRTRRKKRMFNIWNFLCEKFCYFNKRKL